MQNCDGVCVSVKRAALQLALDVCVAMYSCVCDATDVHVVLQCKELQQGWREKQGCLVAAICSQVLLCTSPVHGLRWQGR
jgi:hypothetical protein